jgi:hypothetical protein
MMASCGARTFACRVETPLDARRFKIDSDIVFDALETVD